MHYVQKMSTTKQHPSQSPFFTIQNYLGIPTEPFNTVFNVVVTSNVKSLCCYFTAVNPKYM